MTNAMRYQIEQTSESATLYLAGGLTLVDGPALLAVCDSLPTTVGILRLDLRALGYLSAEAIDVIRRLLRHWGAQRRGEFRLSTSHLMATYRPAKPREISSVLSRPWTSNDALAATYL